MLWFYLILGVTADSFAVYWAKKFVDTSLWLWLLPLAVTILILNYAYIMLLKQGALSVVTPMWLATLTVFSVLMGVLLFNEKLNPMQWIGISLALISIILLQWPTK